MSMLVRVCSIGDVPAESAIPVEVPRNGSRLELAIVHSNGNFYAIYDECSHACLRRSRSRSTAASSRETMSWSISPRPWIPMLQILILPLLMHRSFDLHVHSCNS
jgi:hypothetical protein